MRCSIRPFILLFLLCSCQDIFKAGNPDNVPVIMYKGLARQSAGIMVWADRGIRIDWPSIQFQLANRIQDDLVKSKADEVKLTTWPVLAASIVRYQREHPGIEATPITDIAPKITGVSRLIYIEIESLSTRSDASMQMFRGNAVASMKVVEVTDGHAKVAFEESNIRAIYPPKSPPEGVLNSNDSNMFEGTMVALAYQISRRLASVEEE